MLLLTEKSSSLYYYCIFRNMTNTSMWYGVLPGGACGVFDPHNTKPYVEPPVSTPRLFISSHITRLSVSALSSIFLYVLCVLDLVHYTFRWFCWNHSGDFFIHGIGSSSYFKVYVLVVHLQWISFRNKNGTIFYKNWRHKILLLKMFGMKNEKYWELLYCKMLCINWFEKKMTCPCHLPS